MTTLAGHSLTMNTLSLIGQVDQSQIQNALSWVLGVAFIASILIVGIIWVAKRAPSMVSLALYGIAFLLLCLPIFGLTTQTQQKETYKAVAIPWNITAVRSTAGTKSIEMAPYGEIKKGDMLLKASSPELDAKRRSLESQARKLEFDKRLIEANLALPGEKPILDIDGMHESAPDEGNRRLLRQYRAELQSLELQGLPLKREIARLEIDLQHANEECEQFRRLQSDGFASSAEVRGKEKVALKVNTDASAYRTHLKSIEVQSAAIQEKIEALDNDETLIASTDDAQSASATAHRSTTHQVMRDHKTTKLAQIDLQLEAIRHEIASIESKLIHVAPHDGVVVWQHPSPRSAVPGTPLVAMSKAGESGVLLKVCDEKMRNVINQGDSELSIDVVQHDFRSKESKFDAKCVVYQTGSEQDCTGTCELLLTTPAPAVLVHSLLTHDSMPLEVLVDQETDSDASWVSFIQ